MCAKDKSFLIRFWNSFEGVVFFSSFYYYIYLEKKGWNKTSLTRHLILKCLYQTRIVSVVLIRITIFLFKFCNCYESRVFVSHLFTTFIQKRMYLVVFLGNHLYPDSQKSRKSLRTLIPWILYSFALQNMILLV